MNMDRIDLSTNSTTIELNTATQSFDTIASRQCVLWRTPLKVLDLLG